jgi:hypothetical protein
MKKHFDNNLVWNKDLSDYKGFPRPYCNTDPKFYKLNENLYLHKKIPIPWQTKPLMTTRAIDLIIENEEKVYKESLCAYCGIKFDIDEECIRWKNNDLMITQIGPRVLSDTHPFHKECMSQARIFCPHMRKTKDEEFESGKYDTLIKAIQIELLDRKKVKDMNQDIVKIIDNFVNEEECKTIIKYMNSQNDPKFWISNNTRQMIVNPESQDIKPILLKCLNNIKEKYNNDNLYIAEYMLSRYEKGFSMSVHIDTEDGREYYTISAVIYLNNDFTGGDVVFPNINFRHSPKKGDAALFLSDLQETMHGVEVVDSGVRYVMPIWITDNPKNALKFLHS